MVVDSVFEHQICRTQRHRSTYSFYAMHQHPAALLDDPIHSLYDLVKKPLYVFILGVIDVIGKISKVGRELVGAMLSAQIDNMGDPAV